MRDGAHRRPGAVPDEDRAAPDGAGLARAAGTPAELRGGADTDGDGHPDTLLTADGPDLLVLTDLDGDGLADRVLRIGPDGAVHGVAVHGLAGHGDAAHGAPADLGHVDAGHDRDTGTGSAPAHLPWSALLGHLFGSDP
jgi:hypothetical protein